MPDLEQQLASVLTGRSFVCARVAQQLTQQYSLSVDDLTCALLKLAQTRAVTPMSGFAVGAVLVARNESGDSDFYLGANFEVAGTDLAQAVHAEQAAVHNAHVHGAGQATVLAVTAMPCGHCRQFLQELAHGDDLLVRVRKARVSPASDASDTWEEHRLPDLLPFPFGPEELGRSSTLLEQARPAQCCKRDSTLEQCAEEAARVSYVPYSQAPHGMAVHFVDQEQLAASKIESVAFNPTLGIELAARSLAALHGFEFSEAARVVRYPG